MKKIEKQVLGIDVAKKELVTCYSRRYRGGEIIFKGRKTFANTLGGITAMLVWVKKLCAKRLDIHFVMEATGVYHELVAYSLYEKKVQCEHRGT
jgi:transposase